MLINGAKLTNEQKKQVLAAFSFRWTHEADKTIWNNIGGRPTIPLVSDAEWLKAYSFHFVKTGSRLSRKNHHCELNYNSTKGGNTP